MENKCPQGTFPYVIQSGDNFSNLAVRYRTTVEAITKANPGVDPNRLQIGQLICMPGIAPPTLCPQGSRIYLVQSGDSIYSIAQDFNVPFDVLFSANSGLDPANLQIGQAVCIPLIPACPLYAIPYAIETGDTYYSLSKVVGLPVDELIKANPGVDPNNLQTGQVVCLPYKPRPTLY